jgi:oligosaccharide reducing-end xylanase
MVQWIVIGVGAALLLNSGSGAGAFATGQYRNLFAEAGHPPQQATAKIDAAFQQLFHGDPNTQTVYYPVGTNANGPLAYLTDVANNDVRSEGMSYGMLYLMSMLHCSGQFRIWPPQEPGDAPASATKRG